MGTVHILQMAERFDDDADNGSDDDDDDDKEDIITGSMQSCESFLVWHLWVI